MDKNASFIAVQEAIRNNRSKNPEIIFEKMDVLVNNEKGTYVYEKIQVYMRYISRHQQMEVDILWEEDATQPPYESMGLRLGYNTNFQEFSFSEGYLRWKDGRNRISIKIAND